MAGLHFYLDTNIVIAIIMGSAGLTAAQRDTIAMIDAGVTKAVTSELTLAECLVKPIRDRNSEAVKAYLLFLDSRSRFPALPLT